MTTGLGFTFFDCDNHYYEALDAFTRHIEPQYSKRAMQWAQIDGKQRLLVGGQGQQVHPQPDLRPGGQAGRPGRVLPRAATRRAPTSMQLFGELEPDPARVPRPRRAPGADGPAGHGGRHSSAHARRRHGAGAARTTCPPLIAAFRAFNRWMDEDWGFAYQERIFAAPYITLADPDNAVRELEWALERDARFVVMVGGPVIDRRRHARARRPDVRRRSGPWPTIRASPSATTAARAPTPSTWRTGARATSPRSFRARRRSAAWSRPTRMQDTFANHLAHGLFHRFPNLRMASIETGSAWVFHLFEKLTKSFGQMPAHLPRGPARDVQAARLGLAVLRGRAGQPAGLLGRRPHPHGLGLPPRRGPGRAGLLHQGPEELRLHARAVPHRHARQRSRAVGSPAGVATSREGPEVQPGRHAGAELVDQWMS